MLVKFLLLFILLSSTKCRIQYYEADHLAMEGGDWSVKFFPRMGSKISTITWEFRNETVLSCKYMGLDDGPVISSYFQCSKGCLYEQCQAFNSYGIRVEPNSFRLFAFRATDDMTGNYTLTITFIGKDYNFTAISTLKKTSPSLLKMTAVTCNIPQIEKALKSSSSAVLDKQNLAALNESMEYIREGGYITGNIGVKLGLPEGIVGVYLIRQPRSVHYPDYEPCEFSANTSSLQFSCLVSVDDVGLSILIANSVNSSVSNTQALQTLKANVLKRFALWLLDIPNTDGPESEKKDFGTDYRVIPLKIGWSAVLYAGKKVEIFCPLVKGASANGINCKRTRALYSNSLDTTLPNGFWVEYIEGNNFFYLRKNATEITDSGVYGCTAKVDGHPKPACFDRRLYVIENLVPVRTFFYKEMVPIKALEPKDVYDQYDEAKIPFLVTSQTAFILCWMETDPKNEYALSLDLVREEGNVTTEYYSNLTHTFTLREGKHIMRTYKFFRIGGDGKVESGGKLRATCSISYESLHKTVPDWIIDPKDMNENAEMGQVAAETRYIHVYHAIEGKLKFQGTVDKLDEYPVPLGTVVRCSGASGYPEPVYKWTLIDPTQFSYGYVGMISTASIFIDSPPPLPRSAFQGGHFQVPSDPKYRGMSYLLQCIASNTFAGRKFTTRRQLLLSISLCDSRFTLLDLSLIYSPQMVAGISLVDADNERSTLDIYGERYVYLLQQIILGLSHGSELVRIGMHPTSILSNRLKEAPMYADATMTEGSASRLNFAEGLISQIVRPQAIYQQNPNACPQKYPVNLKVAMKTVLRFIPQSSKRPVAVILPQDRWDIGDTAKFMKSVQSTNGKVISVYFENQRDWVKGKPDISIQIANFSSTCKRYEITDRASLIRRLPLFDAICSIAEPAKMYDELLMVSVFLSHQPHQLFLGENVTLYANVRITPFDQHPVTVWLCLIENYVAEDIQQGETGIDYLDGVCSNPIYKSHPNDADDNCILFELPINLNEDLDNKYLLAYKRSGKPILPTQEISLLPIRLNQGEFSKPMLRMKNPAEKASDSAEFECIFEMARIRFSVYLLHWMKANETYVILARKNSTNLEYSYRHIGHNISVSLILPYFSMDLDGVPIYCVVDNLGNLEDNLDGLPALASEPISHNLSSICPMKPIIRRNNLSPEVNITEGSRISFTCEAVTGENHMHTLQMSYFDLWEDWVICSEVGGGKANTTVPCVFSTFGNRGCSGWERIPASNHPKGPFAKCTIVYYEKGNAFIRKIEFTIPRLTERNFESFVFCETVPTWQVVEEDRFLSDPIDNIFPIGPLVTRVRAGYYEWICQIVSYPPPTNVSWAPIEAGPEKFAWGIKWLPLKKRYIVGTRYRAFRRSPRHYFPVKFIPKEESSRYRFELVRPAPYVIQVGLWGWAKYACYAVGQDNRTAYEEANIRYGYGSSGGDWAVSGSIEPPLGVVQQDNPWTVKCPLRETEDQGEDILINVFLLGQIESPIVKPLDVPLLHVMVVRETRKRAYIRNVTTMGWWSYIHGKAIEVSMAPGHQDDQVVKIVFPKASMFDTGRYMCRFYMYGGYNDAEVIPDLIVPADNQAPIIGYTAENRSWEYADSASKYLTFFDEQHIKSRCVMWRFENPYAPFLNKPFIAQSTERNRNMVKMTQDSIVYTERKIFRHYKLFTINITWQLSVHYDHLKHVGCYWTLDTQEERELGQKFGPIKICAPTEKLSTRPDTTEPMPRDGVIECYDNGEIYQEMTYTWLYTFGPLPRKNESIEVQGIPKLVKSAKLDLSLLPLPGFYIYKCIASSFCGGKEIVSEKYFQFVVVGDKKTPAFTTVSISKPLILVPEKFTVECPSILSEGSALKDLSLVWFRVDRRSHTTSPLLLNYTRELSSHNLINNTVNVSHPNLVAYQYVENRREVFAVDISPSSYDDYGFYGCTTEALRAQGEVKNLSLAQISDHPICIVGNDSSVSMVLKPDRVNECYTENEVLNVYCQALAFQLFCEEDDKPVGARFLETKASLEVVSESFAEIIEPNLFSFRILKWKPPKKTIQYAPVPLTITHDYHEAKVSCVVEPKLLSNPYITESQWMKIADKITKRVSRKICVFSAAANFIIYPTPPEQISSTKVAFKINSGDWITCIAHGNPPPVVTLDVYPMKRGALGEVLKSGLEGMKDWRDYTRAQPDWPSAPLSNDTGSMIMVLRELNDPPDVTYVGICSGTNRVNGSDKTNHKLFVFQIRDVYTVVSTPTFNRYLIVGFMASLFIFAIGTFIHEIVVLRRRHRRMKEE